MSSDDLLRTYEAKADEELLLLAGDREHLTPEARLALASELAKRGIDSGERPAGEEESDQETIDRQWASQGPSLPSRPRIIEFLAEVFRLYHGQFWLFIKLTAPAVILGLFAVILGRNEAREIARHIPRGREMFLHKTELLEMGMAGLAGYLASWTAFCFSFAAICSAVSRLETSTASAIRDCFAELRGRVGAFLRLCGLLFLLLMVAEVAAILLGLGVFWVLGKTQLPRGPITTGVVSYTTTGLALLVFSRFGLAIPAFILDGCSVGQAMFRSDELTEGQWFTLALLLAESLVGGYVAGICPFWIATRVSPGMPLPSWFVWFLDAASVAAVTVVEPRCSSAWFCFT